MPSLTLTGKSGTGSAVISGGTQVAILSVRVNVTAFGAGKYRRLDSGAPKRLQYAGSVVLSALIGGVQYMVTNDHVNFEQHGFPTPSVMSDTVYWVLGGGITATIILDW